MRQANPSQPLRILLVKPKAHLAAIRGLQRYSLLEPLELGYLAATVPEHDVRVLDLRLVRSTGRAFLKALRSHPPDLVGFTGYSHEASIIKGLARMVRQRLPSASIIVGGHHATVAPEDYDVDAIDAIVRGEGCAPFRAIVDALSAGKDLLGIANVRVPGPDFAASAGSEWPRFPDPATLPLPRRDLWNPRDYWSVWASEQMPAWHSIFPSVAMVRTSWGCKMRCSFCVVPYLCGGQHMPRPVESVVDEIASLSAEHVYFSDDENFINEKFAWELAEALAARGVSKRYFAWARSTTVNHSPELMRRWREIGLDAVFLGFEFTTNEELKQATKGGTVAGNERALETLRSIGIVAHAAFMVRPEYTREQFQRLRDYVRAMPPSQCSFTVCTPSPGTPDYEEIKPRIWVPNPFDLHDCMHPLTPTAIPLREFCRRFADQASEGTAKTPLRVNRHPTPPRDLIRIWAADRRYYRGFRKIYRDYPRELWD